MSSMDAGRQARDDEWNRTMLNLFRTSFFWQFAGGFLLGAVGLFALHPAEATKAPAAPTAQAR
jgi:hypothetical protein